MRPAPPFLPPGLRRRAVLGLGALGLWPGAAPGLPAQPLQFPRDHGSHPELRTEWWYITGHAEAAGQLWGFQVTFFRSRVDATQSLRSAFAAKQLLFAHAALTDVQGQRLHHDQRIARAGFGVAQASEADTAVRLHDWSLVRTDLPGTGPAGSRYTARIEGSHFGLDLHCDTTQPLLRQGVAGLSRKGPEAVQASYYYSQPQLAVRGSIVLQGRRMAIDTAEAVGWDWIGMNLHDGSALTAFRLRRADGSALWAGGSFRAPGQAVQVFGADAVAFTPLRFWTSPHSGARYPVQWQVHTPAGRFQVLAVLDDQELDSRPAPSTGRVCQSCGTRPGNLRAGDTWK